MTILSTEEVYFLVRVGSMSPDDLEEWCQARMISHQDDTYDVGFKDGLREGMSQVNQEDYRNGYYER